MVASATTDRPVHEPPPLAKYRTAILGISGLATLFTMMACAAYFARTLEDAFITFRYSEHLAEGYGFGAWNRNGERVEGCTTTLWMLLLAAVSALGLPLVASAKVLGALFHLGTIWAFFVLALRPSPTGPLRLPMVPNDTFRYAAVVAALWQATSLPLAWYSVTGMEVPLFTLLCTLGLFGPYLFASPGVWATTAVLIVLTRPEGIVVLVLVSALYLLGNRSDRRGILFSMLPIGVGLLTVTALTAFRLGWFGWPLPNTYYAKAEGALLHHVQLGLIYAADFVTTHSGLLSLIVLGALVCGISLFRSRGADRNEVLGRLLISAFLLAWFGYVIKVGGDNYWAFPLHRHFLHIAPFFAILAGLSVVHLASRTKHFFPFVVVITLAVVLLDNVLVVSVGKHSLAERAENAWSTWPTWQQEPRAYYRWFLPYVESETTIAAPVAGELPFIIDAVHIDMLGLNDEHIAHFGTFDEDSFIDSKSDMSHVVSRKPDFVLSTLSAKKIIEGRPLRVLLRAGRKQMAQAMVQSPIFQNEYALVRNGPYKSWDRAIFVRRELCRQNKSFDCLQVSKTPLALSLRDQRKRAKAKQ